LYYERKQEPSTWQFEWLGDKKNSSSSPHTDDTDEEDDNNNNNNNSNYDKNYKGTRYDSDDDYDYEEFYKFSSTSKPFRLINEKDLPFTCSYCDRRQESRDSLIKHESICKRLSFNNKNTTKTTTPIINKRYSPPKTATESNNTGNNKEKLTECPKCHCKMNSYEFILHNCFNNNNSSSTTTTTQSASSSTASSPSSSFSSSSTTNKNNNSKSDFVYKQKVRFILCYSFSLLVF
jgi:hypothetical protein